MLDATHQRCRHRAALWAACGALLAAGTLAAAAPRSLTTGDSARLSSAALSAPIESAKGNEGPPRPALRGTGGRHQVLLRLRSPAVTQGAGVTRAAVSAEQAAFVQRVLGIAPRTEVLADLQLAINAVVLDVEAADLAKIARDNAVTRVAVVSDYAHELADTVPYIGAETAHTLGATGAGIRVAVVDSGIDYTHASLGGPGTRAAYEAAWAPLPPRGAARIPIVAAGSGYLVVDDPRTTADDGLFPNRKVIGGYDFVGELWPAARLQPDPDPIAAPDTTTNGGHGTHVADIIGGTDGVAPGVSLYALKACSAVATSCSGVALLQAIEFALDPNGDGDLSDHVDIINMSVGSSYGQPFDEDLSLAVDNATRAGVLTVASAGNGGNKPFISGAPAAASSALSVAQTAMPSATLHSMRLLTPLTGERGAVFQPWSRPLDRTIEGRVFYPAPGAKRLACRTSSGTSPYSARELAGLIVLVDRGSCSFSSKIANLAAAGARIGIIGLNSREAPFAGAYGGGDAAIPGFMISESDAVLLRTGAASVRFADRGAWPLAGSLAATSSRGPRFEDSHIKPEIAAPGASVSAASGSFTGASAFGGTSGAAPMVSGAAAILMAARPELSVMDVKQLLVNTADSNVFEPSMPGSAVPDRLAPVSRIGGGELRIDRALAVPVLVRDISGDAESAGISFGQLDAHLLQTGFSRTLRLTNFTGRSQRYAITPTMRHQDDAATGAIRLEVEPRNVDVPAHASVQIEITMSVDGSKLRNNLMNAGSLGDRGESLTANEYDGYVVFQARDHRLSIPWHILPRKAANVVARQSKQIRFDESGRATVMLENRGVGDAQFATFALLGTSPDRREPGGQSSDADLRAVGINSMPVSGPAFCGIAGNAVVWEFAFSTWERRASPVGTFLEVDFDVDGDGVDDYALINQDRGAVADWTDGRQVAALLRIAPGGRVLASTIRFFVEHATNTSNTILRVCANDLGYAAGDMGVRNVRATFFATSGKHGGTPDLIGPFMVTPYGEEFTGALPTNVGETLKHRQSAELTVRRLPLAAGSSPQAGIMLVTNADFGAGNHGGATRGSELLLLQFAP